MKLYAFQPKGHGQQSFFVMAESEEQAKIAVGEKIKKLLTEGEEGISYSEHDFRGWGTEYYWMTVFNAGEVVVNSND